MDLMELQRVAIAAGDFQTAISHGIRLNAAKREWATLMAQVREGAYSPEVEAEIRRAVDRLIDSHRRMIELLEPERDDLALKIQDIARGRQAVRGYGAYRRSARYIETQV